VLQLAYVMGTQIPEEEEIMYRKRFLTSASKAKECNKAERLRV